jgi:hypothetical protein
MAKCVSCESRKGKRNCPALGDVICNQCCGSKKEKEIICPLDCFYLRKSKKYFSNRQDSQKINDFDREMKSIIGNEEPYIDVLQNVEAVISNIYNERRNICDKDVETALEYLMEMGKGQLDLPSKFLTDIPPHIQTIVDVVNDILEFRESFGMREDLITRLKCIYRVLDSIKTHHDPGDKGSYLKFIGSFLPNA